MDPVAATASATAAAGALHTAPAGLGPWLAPLLILSIGVVVGFVVDRILLARLRTVMRRLASGFDELVLGALRGVVFVWSVLLLTSIAARQAPLDPGMQALIADGVKVAWIASFTLLLARLGAGLVGHALGRGRMQGASSIATISVRVIIFSLGFLLALQTLGIEILPILGALGVGGLAVALALQDTLANLFSGIQLLASRGIAVGDHVRLESGEEGEILDVTMRNTTLRTGLGVNVIVPNSKLAQAVVVNYAGADTGFRLIVPVEVAYGSDVAAVERAVIETAGSSLGELRGPGEPVARLAAFNASGLLVHCVLPLRGWPDQPLARHRFITALLARFAADRIEIPFPTQVIVTRHG